MSKIMLRYDRFLYGNYIDYIWKDIEYRECGSGENIGRCSEFEMFIYMLDLISFSKK